jgi:hypothetical protein
MKCKKLLLLLAITPLMYAAGFSDLAHNSLVPIKIGTHLLALSLLIIGISFLVMSLAFWRIHRNNPVFMPLPKILWTVVLGVICIVIGYLNNPVGAFDVKSNKASIIASKVRPTSEKKHWAK